MNYIEFSGRGSQNAVALLSKCDDFQLPMTFLSVIATYDDFSMWWLKAMTPTLGWKRHAGN